jgi:chromosome segregation ATPase
MTWRCLFWLARPTLDCLTPNYVSQEKLTTLRAEHAHLQASTESSASKLERTKLQLEGAQTRITDLERTNDELKRTNADIQRQLKKWETLENKGDAEVETLRKQRIQLEVEVKELQERADKTADENTRLLEKEKRRVEKYQESLSEWKAVVFYIL